jgi:membrane-bound lytic murein transglycosylase D
MEIPSHIEAVVKRLQSLWTKHTGLRTVFSSRALGTERWSWLVAGEKSVFSRIMVPFLFSLFILPIAILILIPESPPYAAATGVKQEEEVVEVQQDLLLDMGGGIDSEGPLIARALSLASTQEVRSQLDYLTTSKRKELSRSLSLSTKYLPHIAPILEEYGLPRELAYLCLIESGYNLSAKSHAGAVGMWQMIRATSRRFDLVTDNWVDERLDFVRSTEGAARFFLYLKERFDDWDHVLAAYNAGEGRVNKAIRRAGRQKLEPDFGNLALPRETRIYVPAFYAALLIAMEPERYGIFPEYQPAVDFFEVKIPGGVPLATLSKHLECDLDELRYLNPSILKGRVPFRDGGFAVRIPSSVQQDLAIAAAESLNEVRYVSYRVRRGDTIWDISRKFGVSMSRISRDGQDRGNLSRIFPGEILLVALTAGEIS